MNTRLPLVVILGATGSGKTKLSLELAKKFGGEIIGADSMQIYKSLDIITAKATQQERSIAKHHLIDFLNPNEYFTVINYRNRAVKIVDDLLKENKLPIVVGGTNYYIEALLWKILVEDSDSKLQNTKPGTCPYDHTLPSEELHKKLQTLDPMMARRLHPNNKRKIMRALEVLHQKGQKLSDIFEEQQKSEGGSVLGGGLRYLNAVVLWLQCEQKVLDERLDKRVDKMLEKGLMQELKEFHNQYNLDRIKTNQSPDYTLGIFQSIGFKEFHSYLILSEEEQNSETGKKIFQASVEQLKTVTRRYAKKQKKWIKNRFLSETGRQVPPVYGLDTTTVSNWDANVYHSAVEIIESYINNTPCPHKQLPSVETTSFPNARDETYSCDVCNRVFVGHFQWNIHRKSNKHKRVLEYKKEKEKMMKTSVQEADNSVGSETVS